MIYNDAVEKAMRNYYGADTIGARIPIPTQTKQKENQIMTNEQLSTMNKKELNRALTPFMGGYTSGVLTNIKKDDLVDELAGFHKNTTTKSKKNPSGNRKKVTDLIAEVLSKRKRMTSDEIVDAFISKNPDQNEDSLSRTVTRHLHNMRTEYNVEKEKKDGKVFYSIVAR